jgi:hypothetical protein
MTACVLGAKSLSTFVSRISSFIIFLVDRINVTIGGLKKRTAHTSNSPDREEGEELIRREPKRRSC